LFPLRCRCEWVACGVAGSSEDERKDLYFYAVRFEKGTEVFDVCETEPGVW
jgi:hypothetical protein